MGLGTKKRWRIPRRSKSKSKAKKESDDDDAFPTSSESSDEDPSVLEEKALPASMSDVEDSDSDDDLYLDNDIDKSLDKIADLPKPPPTIPASDFGDPGNNVKGTNSNTKNDENHDIHIIVHSKQQSDHNLYNIVRSNQQRDIIDDDDFSDSDSDDEEFSNYEEDMERHRQETRSSPFMSDVLHKIEEESHDDIDRRNSEDSKGQSNEEQSKSPNNDNTDEAGPPQNPKQADKTAKKQKHKTAKKRVYKDRAGNPLILPSHRELSKELCKIVATDHYSGAEFLRALERLAEWAHTQDTNLLKHFLTYGGVVKVVDFLREQIEDPRCEGEFLMECIHKACDVICNVCFVGKFGINEDIAVVNATVVVKYEGIETLLMASNEYNEANKDHPLALKAAEGVWNAIMNVYCNAETAMTKKLSMLVLDAGLQMLARIGSVDHPVAAETIANVFNTFYRITYHGYVTNEEFQKLDILTHCLDVFKRDVTSSDGDEELLEEAISFFYGCHEKTLFGKSSDYERVLPLCVMGLREFAYDNANIREWATKLLDGACSNIQKKETIMMAEGAIEALAPLLTAKDVDTAEKDEVRKLIRKIIAA
ncbi:unnamed protein product [Pseudo-nitzschia multistriata]|uniref:Uncharacterized protein n=1 Tax=Pseudo-nitzschia multistriata TaxID=183589 RepID=A0A448Z312_9STRA|nr:unnamed protein product [Pseudo-nitzschia multistriata]